MTSSTMRDPLCVRGHAREELSVENHVEHSLRLLPDLIFITRIIEINEVLTL